MMLVLGIRSASMGHAFFSRARPHFFSNWRGRALRPQYIMDTLQKLLFPQATVRAETVTLDASFSEAVAHQNLPLAVRRLAGEVTASALLAAAALQYDGTVILQVAGDGPVKLLVVEVRPELVYRVSVTLRDKDASIDVNAGMRALINANGRGQCALILDPANRPQGVQPYQGIVALTGDSFAEVMTNYFITSEQVQTYIALASDEARVGGLMLQKMPSMGGKALPDNYDPEGWDRLKMFAQTVKSEELLTLSPEEIHRRLFWEESPLVTFEGKPIFRCRCSDEGVRQMIRSLGHDEAKSIIDEMGEIEVTCHYCGQTRHFDAIDVETIFSKAPVQAVSETRHESES